MKVLRDPLEQVIRYTRRLPTDCWNWDGPKKSGGYGRLKLDGKKDVSAHRWVYEKLRGKIPKGMHIDHLCTNRACVNPQHMEVVTNRENIRRGNVDWRKYLTHCKRGHPYDGDNLYTDPRGKRVCKECRRASKRKWVIKMRKQGASSARIAGRKEQS